jgi:hypothetical protein
LALILAGCLAGSASAGLVELVNENFDSMGVGPGTVTAPAGWTVGYLGAVGSQNRLAADPYAGNGQAITSMTIYSVAAIGQDYRTRDALGAVSDVGRNYNCGTNADRALGAYARTNPSGDHIFQVAFTNTTGVTIDSFNLDYDLEQWGQGQGASSSGPEMLRVLFSSTSATDGFVYLGSAFDGVAPKQGAGSGIAVIDGNAADNKVHVSGTFALPTALAPGAAMYLRFHDWNDNSTSDHLLAIDNVRLTAVPEPSTLVLLASGLGLALVYRARRRR